MIVVDASTLILLAKTTILDLFVVNFMGKIFIGETVKSEVLSKDSADAKLIENRIKEIKIKVKSAKNKKAVEQIMKDFSLDIGEAETIRVCLENNWQLVGTDDRKAIKACIVLEINYATAIDILLALNRKNILDKDEALLKLEKLFEFGWYDEHIIKDAENRLR